MANGFNITSAPTTQSLLDIYNEQAVAADKYIDDLLGQAAGDRDFAIKQLKREHELALGTDDQARAQFLESVADRLESRIGTIPYDYQVGTTRTAEDLARVEEVTKRNTDLALQRLSQDEQTWRQQFGRETQDLRQSEAESLSKRGLLTGTREQAQGIAGREVGQTEQGISDTLSAYDRALGRSREDIGTQASDTLFEARRGAERTQQDLTTAARRGAIAQQDQLQFGTEAAQRAYEARQKELERLRAREKQLAQQSAVTLGSF